MLGNHKPYLFRKMQCNKFVNIVGPFDKFPVVIITNRYTHVFNKSGMESTGCTGILCCHLVITLKIAAHK